MPERPLHIHHGVVIVFARHGCHILAGLIVVSRQCTDHARISERQSGAEICISRKQVGQGIAAVIARQQDVDHGLRKRLDIAYDARAAFIEDQHKRLPGRRKGPHQLRLVLRKVQVIHVTRRFAVGIFAYTGNNHIGSGRR